MKPSFFTERRLGREILSVDETGRWTFGRPPERGEFDLDAAAERMARRGWPAWKGPSRHVLALPMGPERLRAAVDFACRSLSPVLTLELACEDAAAAWSSIWFAVQYGRRREEWDRRRVLLVVRARAGLDEKKLDFLRGHGALRRLVLSGEEPPRRAAFAPQRARLDVAGGDPKRWADWLAGEGCESVLLKPSCAPETFAAFYRGFLDRLEEAEYTLREEWTESFLRGAVWSLPGLGLASELAYAADGSVLAGEGGPSLGTLPGLRYHDLADSAAARSLLLGLQADHQPYCHQCSYRPFCAVSPRLGPLINDPECRTQMGLLDEVFGRLNAQKTLSLLAKWGVDI